MIKDEVAKIYRCEALEKDITELVLDAKSFEGASGKETVVEQFKKVAANLLKQAEDINSEILAIQGTINDMAKIQSLAHNIRYMVHELMLESNITCDMLAEKLGFSAEDIQQALSPGSPRADIYNAFCEYFELDKAAYAGYLM